MNNEQFIMDLVTFNCKEVGHRVPYNSIRTPYNNSNRSDFDITLNSLVYKQFVEIEVTRQIKFIKRLI